MASKVTLMFGPYGALLLVCFIMFFKPCLLQNEKDRFTRYPNIQPSSKEEFESAMSMNTLTMAYFYQKDFKSLNSFLKVLNELQPYLKDRGINSILVDCFVNNITQYCYNSHRTIRTFQDGEELIDLSVQHMFDEDSVISNMLQLLLINKIPVLLQYTELQQYEHEKKGSYDAIFSVFEAIGSSQHRAFIETAYEHIDKINFTISTEARMAKEFGLKSENMITGGLWLIKCKGMAVNDPDACPHVRMYEPVTTESITRFIESIHQPIYFESQWPVQEPKGLLGNHVIYIFRGARMEKLVDGFAKVLTDKFSPSVAICVIDTNKDDMADMGYTGSLPALGLKLSNQPHEKTTFAPSSLTPDTAVQFVTDQLMQYLTSIDSNSSDAMDSKEGQKNEPKGYRKDIDRLEEVSNDNSEVNSMAQELENVAIDYAHLTPVTDMNFIQVINDAPVLVILYHLKFDARSKVLLHVYANVSRVTSSRKVMAHVDCHEWKTVCDTAGVVRYPRILIYRRGHPTPYTGAMDGASLANMVVMLQKNTYVELTDVNQAQSFLTAAYPSAEVRFPANISILGLVKTEKQAKEFMALSTELQTIAFFGLAKGKVAMDLSQAASLSVPRCVLIQHNDRDTPYVEYQGSKFTRERLRKFVKSNLYPVFTELTAVSYPSLVKGDKYLLVLFTTDLAHESPEWKVMSIVAGGRLFAEKLVCTWMDVSDTKSVGASVLRTYTFSNTVDAPKLMIISQKLGGVYTFAEQNFDQEYVETWIKAVINKNASPSYKLRHEEWKPTHTGFDFLRMIDEGIRAERFDEDDNLEPGQTPNDHGPDDDQNGDELPDDMDDEDASFMDDDAPKDLEDNAMQDKKEGDGPADMMDVDEAAAPEADKKSHKHDGNEL